MIRLALYNRQIGFMVASLGDAAEVSLVPIGLGRVVIYDWQMNSILAAFGKYLQRVQKAGRCKFLL